MKKSEKAELGQVQHSWSWVELLSQSNSNHSPNNKTTSKLGLSCAKLMIKFNSYDISFIQEKSIEQIQVLLDK